jgi:hypothetical protein
MRLGELQALIPCLLHVDALLEIEYEFRVICPEEGEVQGLAASVCNSNVEESIKEANESTRQVEHS